MLDGLSALELVRLRMSVGYGTHKKGRPFSPVEVGVLIHRARAAGNTLADCAREMRIDETGLRRFIRLLELPEDLRHLVDWGGGKHVVGFSCAAELVRITNTNDMRTAARAVLESGLNSKEARQVSQLLDRSDRPVTEVLQEVIGMRPVVERRYVFIGTVTNKHVVLALKKLTQREKDALLAAALASLGLVGASGRLGTRRFTLVGDDRFGSSMSVIGKGHLEGRLCAEMAKGLGDVASCG